ncbi:tryptophan 7-halogenase [Aestuariibacter sp. AA17]|uniref:Tryptophan 7-halogenase n=1 Tax=Fluctibacter corallii TaxID=2984329 RepID=A0ABT3A9R4_9ALTE|nr:tryptophan halogenase family protein [Aestuariibacter sp. AA17]MCV2885339.1 tryptophan 7-halogenase [Aestuariibacter sp. AA17]
MRIVILGGGSSGWMSASLLARLMGNQLDITLVESEHIGTIGVGEATIPPITHFNKVLGIDENTFIQKTNGTFKLGIEFVGWKDPTSSYMHAFGQIGKDMGLAPFHHNWLNARSNGYKNDFWHFSLNYQAAKAGKFQPLPRIPNTRLPGIVHAYHFDAGLYAQYLQTLSTAWGVKRIEGEVEHVSLNKENGEITALRLKSGQVVEGDFFIDCSGFKGVLISEALKTGYEDWRHWLPCDRALAVPTENTSDIPPYTQSIAHQAGWQWRIPLQHRTGNGLVYCSDYLDDNSATELLLGQLNTNVIGTPKPIKFVTGRRVKQWHKNCLAIGLSSGFLEPLESTSLHLVQSGLVRFMKLLPNKSNYHAAEREFNRQSEVEFTRIRDFIILHYVLNNRNEPFWKRCRDMPIPDSLAHKIALFKATGQVFREQDELFTDVAWHQVMLGQGLMPEACHPLAEALSGSQTSDLFSSLETLINATVADMSEHTAYIQQYCRMDNPR